MKAKLTVITLSMLLITGSLMAEPWKAMECCEPQPVGGMETLMANAEYPELAIREHLEADVILHFTVDRYGQVSDISVVKSGGLLFDRSAAEAVMKTKWKPAQQAGNPIGVTFELPFEYRAR